MNLFPLFEDITDKTFLIVGGGRIAREKLEKLKPFTDRLVVVAPELSISEDEVWILKQKPFEDSDLETEDYKADYVIGATDNREVNKHVAALCRERKIPINTVDDPELCTFIFPSLVKRGDLVVGITTAGKSPAFGQYVRHILERELPEDTEQIIDELYALKQQLKETEPEQKERARQLKAYLRERVAWED